MEILNLLNCLFTFEGKLPLIVFKMRLIFNSYFILYKVNRFKHSFLV